MARSLTEWLTGVVLLSMAASAAAQERDQLPLLIRGATVVDVRTGALDTATSVLISGDRIVRIARDGRDSVPAGARVIDARGRFLIPGLIDTHVHLFQPWNFNWPDSIAQLGWILASGVTTVRDASGGGILEPTYAAFDAAAEAGIIVAPRIVVSGQVAAVMRSTGASTRDDALAAFPALGLDQVKLIGIRSVEAALETIRASRRAGMTAYGHTRWRTDDTTVVDFPLAAIEAGISGLSHSSGRYRGGKHVDAGLRGWLDVDEDWQRSLIASAVARGVWLEPTLTVTYAGNRLVYGHCTDGFDVAKVREYYPFHPAPRSTQATAAEADTIRAICAAHWKFIRDFHEAGGMIVAGSDFVPFAPLGVVEEVRLLVAAGLTPLAALQAATINAAHALDLAAETGTIETGKRADLVLLAGNPLSDVSNLRRVEAVIAGGRVVDIDALWDRRGTNPPVVAAADDLSRIGEDARELMRSDPRSEVEVLVTVNDLMHPGDPHALDRFLGFSLVSVSGSELRLRGPAGRLGLLSRLRFVEQITLANQLPDRAAAGHHGAAIFSREDRAWPG